MRILPHLTHKETWMFLCINCCHFLSKWMTLVEFFPFHYGWKIWLRTFIVFVTLPTWCEVKVILDPRSFTPGQTCNLNGPLSLLERLCGTQCCSLEHPASSTEIYSFDHSLVYTPWKSLLSKHYALRSGAATVMKLTLSLILWSHNSVFLSHMLLGFPDKKYSLMGHKYVQEKTLVW